MLCGQKNLKYVRAMNIPCIATRELPPLATTREKPCGVMNTSRVKKKTTTHNTIPPHTCHTLLSKRQEKKNPLLRMWQTGYNGPRRSVAKRSYPTSEVRGSSRECQAETAQSGLEELPTPEARAGAARSNLTSKEQWLRERRRV